MRAGSWGQGLVRPWPHSTVTASFNLVPRPCFRVGPPSVFLASPPLCRRHTYADGVDIGLVPGEGLTAGALPHIPQFGSSVASPRDEEFEVWGDGQAHTVAGVSQEHSLLLPCLNVPESTVGEERISQSQPRQNRCRAGLKSCPTRKQKEESHGPGYSMGKQARVSLESVLYSRRYLHSCCWSYICQSRARLKLGLV